MPSQISRRSTSVATLCLSLLLPLSAQATTFVEMSDQQLVDQSQAIAIGKVTDIRLSEDANGTVQAYISMHVKRDILGAIPKNSDIVIHEVGGITAKHATVILGNAKYRKGHQYAVHLVQDTDGYFKTLQMALGRRELRKEASSNSTLAYRDLGEADVYKVENGKLVTRSTKTFRRGYLERMEKLAQHKHAKRLASINSNLPADANIQVATNDIAGSGLVTSGNVSVAAANQYALMTPNSRWRDGPVPVYADTDTILGLTDEESVWVVQAAAAAWTGVTGSTLALSYAGRQNGSRFECGATPAIRLTFNDPANQVTNPSGCGGTLAIGGFCSSGSTFKTQNGVALRQITSGSIVVNNGWQGCYLWTATNVSETVTHEIGHSLGLGHSNDGSGPGTDDATMYSMAHFDGRGASLHAYDKGAIAYLYPDGTPPPETGAAPSITGQPSSQQVTEGSNVTFSVSATGSSLSYQWQRNGLDIAGATSATYSMVSTMGNNGDQYRVSVQNGAGTVMSNTATLTVRPNTATHGFEIRVLKTTVAKPTTSRFINFAFGIRNIGTVTERDLTATITVKKGNVEQWTGEKLRAKLAKNGSFTPRFTTKWKAPSAGTYSVEGCITATTNPSAPVCQSVNFTVAAGK